MSKHNAQSQDVLFSKITVHRVEQKVASDIYIFSILRFIALLAKLNNAVYFLQHSLFFK